MAARVTIERILRDDDDHAGQSIREWKIEAESGHITLRARENLNFLLLRASDIDLLRADLSRAKIFATSDDI